MVASFKTLIHPFQIYLIQTYYLQSILASGFTHQFVQSPGDVF